MKKRGCLLLACCVAALPAFGQKKVLDQTVFDTWKSLDNIAVTHDGRYAVAIVSEQEGDSRLLIHETASGREFSLPRAYRYGITPDQQRVVALIKAPFADIRQAKIKKTNAEKMPKDTLAIVGLSNFTCVKIAQVGDFRMGKDFSDYLAFTLSDTVKHDEDEGKTLIVRRLADGWQDTVRATVDFRFSRNGKALAVLTGKPKKDSLAFAQALFVDLDTYKRHIVSRKLSYKHIALSEKGDRMAFLSTDAPKKQEIKEYRLRYYLAGSDSAAMLCDRTTDGMPDGWVVSEFRTPEFSKSGSRLFVGIAPEQAPKDTLTPDFEKARVDVWHWQDPKIQPQQLVELKTERQRSYLAMFDLVQGSPLYPLASPDRPNVQLSDENDGRYALLTSNLPYVHESTWNAWADRTYDLRLIDLKEHTQRPVVSGLTGELHFSPKGNCLVWYNAKDSAYHGYSVATGREVCLTCGLGVNFWDEKNDRPMLPSSRGVATWTDDEKIIVYDACDLWKLDPTGTTPPQNLTKGAGRAAKLRLRYFRTDPDSRFVSKDETLYLTAFDETSKERGFYRLDKRGLRRLVMDKYSFSTPVKAKNKAVFAFTRANFSTSPDLYATSDLWKTMRRLSDINPQMRDYNWGTAELLAWKTIDGTPTEGILYKPEDFDPAKRYPMIVYYYEKHSDELYSYIAPIPSRSIINIPFFVSRGYLVFSPDIQYIIGHPGQSAYNSIIPGVEMLCRNSWVDSRHLGIQGQSWGGYQTAWMVTRTNIFAAAGAGAPVSNMFSAYGGIRWATGMSRQFQYEQTQSRIGKTPWEAPELYIENSPLFFADKVHTPLLIMHNDKDGAVPWYQGIEYYMALRRLNRPVWLLQYNDEQHNLTERRNRKDLSIKLEQFFDHYLKGTPMAKWMEKGVPAISKGL